MLMIDSNSGSGGGSKGMVGGQGGSLDLLLQAVSDDESMVSHVLAGFAQPSDAAMMNAMNTMNTMNAMNAMNSMNAMNGHMNGSSPYAANSAFANGARLHGTMGMNGLNGFNGLNGMNGLNGLNGLNGASNDIPSAAANMMLYDSMNRANNVTALGSTGMGSAGQLGPHAHPSAYGPHMGPLSSGFGAANAHMANYLPGNGAQLGAQMAAVQMAQMNQLASQIGGQLGGQLPMIPPAPVLPGISPQASNMLLCSSASTTSPAQAIAAATPEERTERYDRITKIITELKPRAFREDLFTEPLCRNMYAILSLCEDEIRSRLAQSKDGGIDILYKISAKVMGKSVGKLSVADDVRLIFEASYILLYSDVTKAVSSYIGFPEFYRKYPEFAEEHHRIDPREKDTLLLFRNIMAVSQKVIPPHHHKNHLIDLVTRLTEGKGIKYIVGSGQSDKTSRRVLIYRREGNVPLISKTTSDSASGYSGGGVGAGGYPGTPFSLTPPPLGAGGPDTGSNDDDDVPNGDGAAASTPLGADPANPHASLMVHKLEKRRNKHLMYLESMTHTRQDQIAHLRAQAMPTPAPSVSNASLHSIEILFKEGDTFKKFILDNVISVRQVTHGEPVFIYAPSNPTSQFPLESSNATPAAENVFNKVTAVSMDDYSSDQPESLAEIKKEPESEQAATAM
jgi:hypothetical protein